MIQKIVKVALYTLSFLALLALGVVLMFRLMPMQIISAVSHFTEYEVSATKASTQLWPLKINLDDLSIRDGQKEIAQLENTELVLDWTALIGGRNNYWFGRIDNGEINYSNFPAIEENQSATQEGQSTDAEASDQPINIHHLLSTLALHVNSVRLVLAPKFYVDVKNINSSLNTYTSSNPSEVEQNIEAKIVYSEDSKQVPITGSLRSFQKNELATIELKLGTLDLRSLFGSNSIESQSTGGNDSEPTIDWSWLESIDPISIAVSANQVLVDDLHISDLMTSVLVDESFKIKFIKGTVQAPIGDDYEFNSKVEATGNIKPVARVTEHADLVLDLEVRIAKNSIEVQGPVNINGLSGTNADLRLSLLELPIDSLEQDSRLLLAEQYLPLGMTANVHSKSDNLLMINALSMRTGESEFNGGIDLTFEDQQLASLKVDLSAPKISFKSQVATQDSEKEVQKSGENEIFSDAVITWPWDSGLQIEGSLKAEELEFDQYIIKDIVLPVILTERSLLVENASAVFSQGKAEFTLDLSGAQAGAAIELSGNLSDMNLSTSGLLPADQLSGGLLQGQLELSTQGKSSKELANDLQGDFLLSLHKAKINNSSLNLIGSDIVLETIAKLNPFAKSDPFTHVDCAIINADIEQGIVEFDKSLAFETDKMAIVGNGKINLNTEKVDIKLSPKAHGGVGLNAGTVLKLMEIGGTLANPRPIVSAGGLLKTGVAIGAAVSTGGVSLLADGFINKAPRGSACQRALDAFSEPGAN